MIWKLSKQKLEHAFTFDKIKPYSNRHAERDQVLSRKSLFFLEPYSYEQTAVKRYGCQNRIGEYERGRSRTKGEETDGPHIDVCLRVPRLVLRSLWGNAACRLSKLVRKNF